MEMHYVKLPQSVLVWFDVSYFSKSKQWRSLCTRARKGRLL